jgi:hypothetical protein
MQLGSSLHTHQAEIKNCVLAENMNDFTADIESSLQDDALYAGSRPTKKRRTGDYKSFQQTVAIRTRAQSMPPDLDSSSHSSHRKEQIQDDAPLLEHAVEASMNDPTRTLETSEPRERTFGMEIIGEPHLPRLTSGTAWEIQQQQQTNAKISQENLGLRRRVEELSDKDHQQQVEIDDLCRRVGELQSQLDRAQQTLEAAEYASSPIKTLTGMAASSFINVTLFAKPAWPEGEVGVLPNNRTTANNHRHPASITKHVQVAAENATTFSNLWSAVKALVDPIAIEAITHASKARKVSKSVKFEESDGKISEAMHMDRTTTHKFYCDWIKRNAAGAGTTHTTHMAIWVEY